MKFTATLVLAVLALNPVAYAAAVFRITEAWTGLASQDGTSDWFEVTNFGDAVGDTATLVYDDSSPTLATGGVLSSILLAPSQSAIFLVDSAPADPLTYSTAAEEFAAIWGPGILVGQTNGGGNLGQGGDSVNLLLAGVGTVIDTLAYTSSGALATFHDPTGLGPITLSLLGVGGAYQSAAFVNDSLPLPPETTVTVLGSPGSIPEPAAVALAVLALAATASRCRKS